jgi:hypothetical protein
MAQVVGKKELAQRELQKGKLSRAHKMMIEDGLPEKCVRTGSGPKLKRETTSAGISLAPPIAVQKAIAADLAEPETETTNAPAPPAAEPMESTVTKKTSTKKAAKAKARTPVKAAAKTTGRPDGLRTDSKQAKLLDAAVAAGAKGSTEAELCKKLGGWKKCAVTLRRVCEKVGAKVERADGRFVVTLKKTA